MDNKPASTVGGARPTEAEHRSGSAKRTVIGATLQECVDQYDLYLPTIVLAIAIPYFQPHDLPRSASLTIYYLVFVIGILGRPVGSVLLGYLADRIGRRKAILTGVAGFTMATLLIGLLPGFATLGYAAIVLLLVLRFVDGIFLGGGVTSAGTIAMEAVQPHYRGLVGGIVSSAYPIGNWAIALTTSLMLAAIPEQGFIQWGWRIPFYIGTALSLTAFIYFYRNVPESPVWRSRTEEPTPSAVRRNPLRALIGLLRDERYRRRIVAAFVLLTGYWLMVYLVASTIPTSLESMGFDGSSVSNVMLIAYVPLFAAYIGFGALSQVAGRRRSLLISGSLSVLVVPAMFYYMITQTPSFGISAMLVSIMLCITLGVLAPVKTPYLNEIFPTHVRAIGYGAIYTIPAIIPAMYPFYLRWIGNLMPYEVAHVPLVAVGGLLIVIGAWFGNETKDVHLGE
jgi:MFS family permease